MTQSPCAVLLDLLMPGLDGFEVLSKLRAIPKFRDLPVFVMTAKDLSAEELQLLRQQASAVIKKEEDWRPQLIAQVSAALERRSTGRHGTT